MVHIVPAEILNECWYLPLKLGVKGFDDIEAFTCGLTCNYPVDIGVIIHTNANGRIGVDILVSA